MKIHVDKAGKVILLVIGVLGILLVVYVILYELTIRFSGDSPVSSGGFAKIKPVLANTGLEYRGNFSAEFHNEAGGEIILDGGTVVVKAEDYPSKEYDGNCSISFPEKIIKSGGTFKAYANDCIAGNPGDPYTADITIAYKMITDGAEKDYIDNGWFRYVLET